MQLNVFMKKSGFKALATARLSSCEYSIALYLLNCAVSNLDHIVITESELARAIGYQESDINTALKNLHDHNIVKIRSKRAKGIKNTSPSLHLCFEFEIKHWHFEKHSDKKSSDAVVYPFHGSKLTQVIKTGQKNEVAGKKPQTWQRVLNAFAQARSVDEDELEDNKKFAKILVETHPVDQILLILLHFGLRIPTLSLLASNWDHYQELFEQETQKVDFSEARLKHQKLNETLKKNCKAWLKGAVARNLSPSEINILKLFIRHRHPRRQLFWAYQARSRYTNLQKFFEENSKLMIAVSSSGNILKKPPH